MRLTILLLISVLSHSTCNSQAIDCKKFKTGSFYYPSIPGKLSVRTDSIQKSYSDGQLQMIWKVKWLTDCKYEMTLDSILVENGINKKGDRIVATIYSTDENCYTASIVFYCEEIPEGEELPGGPLCISKEN